jgi:hypothetical protein
VIYGGAMLEAQLLFAIELVVLYVAGSYVMGRLMRISGFGGSGNVMGRVGFYLLVYPGVVLLQDGRFGAESGLRSAPF